MWNAWRIRIKKVYFEKMVKELLEDKNPINNWDNNKESVEEEGSNVRQL